MVGTFYRSSGPDKGPFVKVGDSIEVNAPGGSKAYEILAVNWG